MHAELGLQGISSGRSLERWGATRGFFGIVSFLLVGGMISTILLAALADWHRDDKTGVVLGSIACGTMMLFTIRKVTPMSQPGFWREWLRPFLMTVSLFGIGATITFMARHLGDEGVEGDVAMITGLVMSTMMFFVVAALRGKRREAAPFVTNQPDDGFKPQAPKSS